MKRIKVVLNTGFAGVQHEDILEFKDDATDEEIEEEVKEWAWNCLDLCWYEEEQP